jgi:hypothetical protein
MLIAADLGFYLLKNESMSLFRCSSIKKNNSHKFINFQEQIALKKVLKKIDWIDHFDRPPGITARGITRFGPQRYPQWPLYVCKRKETTVYEYAYWKLKHWKTELNKPLNIAIIIVDFIPKEKPLFISSEEKGILSRETYDEAHGWLLGLDAKPASISYPSVRCPAPGGTNYAIYNSGDVGNIYGAEELVMTIISETEVSILKGDGTSYVISPLTKD